MTTTKYIIDLFDLFFFFFSSRRRHTRCSRDWSSDVCSSDLKRDEEHAIRMHREASDIFRAIGDRQSEGIALNGLGQAYERSEERRVGKECRSRWSPYH